MTFKHWLVVSTAVGLGVGVAPTAWAQTAPGPASQGAGQAQSGAQPAADGNEVVVTAQKRKQSLQKVPLAVSAFTSRERDVMGIDSAQDLVKFTPSMSFSQNPQFIYIRGIGQSSTSPSVEPGVAIYNDGVYSGDLPSNASSLGASSLLADRIEVLRGPQGTLYGKNTNGGAINIISKRPTDDFTAELRETLGDYEISKTGATVSGPITDKLRYRLTATYDWQGQGYTHNIAGTDPGIGGELHIEGQIEADITPDLNVWLKYGHDDVRQTALISSVIGPYDTTDPTLDGFIEINPLYGYNTPNPSIANPRRIAENTTAQYQSQYDTLSLNAAWTIGDFATLKYLGGYANDTSHVLSDLDNSGRTGNFIYDGPLSELCDPTTHYGCVISPVDVADTHAGGWNYSNELDLISSGNHRLNWVLGLFQFAASEPYDVNLERPLQTELTSIPGNADGAYIESKGGARENSYAVFGQADFNVTNTLTLEGGLRFTYDQKEISEGLPKLIFYGPIVLSGAFADFNGPGTCDQATCNIGSPGAVSFSKDYSGITGKLALQWRPDAETNLYALVSTGYKSGVLTSASPAASIPAEQLIDYEAGLKKQFGPRLTLDLTAFYYDYTHIQIQTNGPDPSVPGNFTQVWISAPKARTYGFEAEGTWRPIDNVDLLFSYSYLNATILQLNGVVDIADTARGVQNVSGNALPQSPKNKLTVDVGYTWRFDAGSLRASVTNSFTDKRYYDIFDVSTYEGKPYDQVDLRAVWNSANGKFTAIAFADNVTDAESVNYISLSGSGALPAWLLNPPRTFGIELQRRF
jgi:iron complex outermembrane receptor protein